VQDGFKTRILRRILCFRTAQVVAVSEDARSVAVRSHAVPINKLCIVHNGIDTRRNFEVEMRSHRDAMREKLGISAGTTVIGTVGRLSPEKDYTMVLVGDGIERSQLEREAERLGVQTLCRFAGEQRNVPAWLSIFNVFCLSSRTEGLSISLLEAGACGLPCVVTDVGGNREVVRDGHNGFLVPYRAVDQMAAAFRRLHTDPEMRVRMGGNARENVDAHFSLKKTIDDYEQLYMSV
jgi:glycosyltransferase involved in cell wall biosynthesis